MEKHRLRSTGAPPPLEMLVREAGPPKTPLERSLERVYGDLETQGEVVKGDGQAEAAYAASLDQEEHTLVDRFRVAFSLTPSEAGQRIENRKRLTKALEMVHARLPLARLAAEQAYAVAQKCSGDFEEAARDWKALCREARNKPVSRELHYRITTRLSKARHAHDLARERNDRAQQQVLLLERQLDEILSHPELDPVLQAHDDVGRILAQVRTGGRSREAERAWSATRRRAADGQKWRNKESQRSVPKANWEDQSMQELMADLAREVDAETFRAEDLPEFRNGGGGEDDFPPPP